MNAGGPRSMNKSVNTSMTSIEFRFSLPDHQALSRVIVDHVQGPERPPVMSSFMDEVVRPYVIGMLWPQTDARSIVEPEPPMTAAPTAKTFRDSAKTAKKRKRK